MRVREWEEKDEIESVGDSKKQRETNVGVSEREESTGM